MLIPPRIKRIFTESGKNTLSVYKSGPGTQAFLAHSALQSGRDVVVLMRDSRELQEFQALTRLLSPAAEDSKNFWDQRWIVFDDLWSESRAAAWGSRWAALFALSMGQGPKGVLATVDNFLPYWPELQALEEAHLFLFKSEDVPLQEIQDKLSCWGYERVSLVSRPGEFSCRGDILDVFAPGYELPVRLEFFADTLESMRLFEPLSQRSSQELSQLVLLPVAPAVLSPGYILQAREYWSHLWKTGELSKAQKSRLELRLEEDPAYIWPGLFYAQKSTLQQWLKTESIFLVPHAEQLVPCLQEKEQIWREHQQRQDGQDVDIPGELLVQSAERARQTWLDKSQILFEDLHGEQPNEALELAEKRYASFQDLFWKPETRTRPWRTLQQALQEWSRTKNQVILSFQQEHSRSRFLKLFQDGLEAEIHTEYQPGKKGIYALISSLDSGLELQWNHLLLLAEDVLQPRKEQTASRAAARKGDFKGLSSSDQIQDGDLLVHRDYGVGRFAGLTRLQVDEAGNDYLLLLYAQGDKLYVPVDRLNLVQPFKGPDGSSPELDKLGSNRWGRTKDRVRKALEAIAQDLVQMYAYRKVAKGYVYPSVDELYREFEATFDFQETPDQEQAISEVLRDMESPEPMDRLICGDAGFGKTEVAMRAAFRAVAAGKQVALLCPTTVLAEQHYQNFKARLQDFSVHVELLSRFVPVSRQKKILEQAEKGAVDILIGTHRLLSNDVRLPKLTLFILDEEQRFGVRHKEKLKEIRRNIDVLTLTATPIPRTLQLSLSGIRQLSVIETPPQERKPVKSGLIEKDSAELRQILRREMERGGQVFWVYNRVQGLEKIKEYVQSLVPEARVGIAHGQLSERRLEEAMHSFWHGKLDVLVCTAIIESGLDFPRANTLIVDQAQMFGLGQLYQLRGRVGRSRHQAYAYFLVPSVAALPEKAKKRLQAVLEMDYMGAGFHVAMEDLRIRGAGNILGEMQSGNMNKVGLELFLEMLEQEVRKYKGEELNQKSEPELNITFEANIPGSYISDPQERLYYYRKISSAVDSQVLRGWEEEIQDRFGPMPEQLRNLFSVLELKLILARLQVDRADLFPNRAVLSWPDDSRPLDPEAFLSWLNHCNLSARFQPPAKLELRFEDKASISNAIRITGQELGVLQEQARN